MNSDLTRRIQALFDRELTRGQKRHIVFWYDDAGEYASEASQLSLSDVRIIYGNYEQLFQLKYELEEVYTEEHVLLYFPHEQPDIHEDWLRDIYEYSFCFHMDEIALLMEDLGLEGAHLRVAFDRYQVFFRARKRRDAFRRVAERLSIHDADSVDLAVLTAVTKAPVPEFFSIVKQVCSAEAQVSNQPWAEMVRYGVEDVFWRWVKRYFGYPWQEEQPSVEHFVASMLATHAADELSLSVPTSAVMEVDPVHSEVLINQWQNDPHHQANYRQLAEKYEERLDVASWVEHVPIERLIAADTFKVFDERLIRYVTELLVEGGQDDERYIQWLRARRTTHWYDQYEFVYKALHAALTLKAGVAHMEQEGLPYGAQDLFDYYCQEGYRLDTAYRHFYTAYDRIQMDIPKLEDVRQQVEHLYVRHFLTELDYKWSRTLEGKEQVQLPGVSQQTEFYSQFVDPLSHQRVFVIISDAFRYELARELTDQLQSEHRFSTDLQAMTGMIPSYTALGMAALLPHQQLAVQDGKIIADGRATDGTKAREEVLAATEPSSVAMTYAQYQVLYQDRTALRKRLKGKKIVYIYHNQIDHRGESGPGEQQVFAASEDAKNELINLVGSLFTAVSASQLFITADHGFIYTRDPVPESERRPRSGLHGELQNRRFIVNQQSSNEPGTLTFRFPALVHPGPGSTGQSEETLYVHTPRGMNRFVTRGGGENYVHGGAMLQEITIPVLHIKTDRQGARARETPAPIQLTSITRKISTSVTYLEFLQRERIADKVRPAHYQAMFVDRQGLPITNVVHILAESRSEKPQERTFREKFVFTQRMYDPHEDYDLLITYKDGTEYERIPFTIDIPWV